MLGLIVAVCLLGEIGYVEPWGKDAHLTAPAPAQQETKKTLSPLAKVAEQCILFHHKVITQIDGPRSHFRPSSSTYMLQAIYRHGFFKGYILGCDRLLRENADPWHYRTKLINGLLYKWDPPPGQEPNPKLNAR
jgi:putative component of membrane protein insertase Oxa1/YidC/SpoIIIJ protein YidD